MAHQFGAPSPCRVVDSVQDQASPRFLPQAPILKDVDGIAEPVRVEAAARMENVWYLGLVETYIWIWIDPIVYECCQYRSRDHSCEFLPLHANDETLTFRYDGAN